MKKTILLFLFFIFAVPLIAQEEVSDEKENDVPAKEVPAPAVKKSTVTADPSFEFPLGLFYGFIEGSDINCGPGSSSDFNPCNCAFLTGLGAVFPTEPVYYRRKSGSSYRNYFGISNSSYFNADIPLFWDFYTGFKFGGSADFLFSEKGPAFGAKGDLFLRTGIEQLGIFWGGAALNGGISGGFLGKTGYFAPVLELEITGDNIRFTASYLDGRFFGFDIRRIAAGFRFFLG